jgi:DNA-binding response OmpR family regulator
MTAARPCVLIVEDEWLLAEMVEETVRDCGCDVTGPVPSVDLASKLINKQRPDAAILDVSLGPGKTSFPIARLLLSHKVPFLFVTGYSETDLPAEFRHHQLLRKPVEPIVLQNHLAILLAENT